MSIWEFTNSPLFLTIVSFILGGVIASAISAAWQRRSQRHSLRLTLSQEILNLYHDYIRYIKKDEISDEPTDFDRIHSGFLSRAKMAKVFFNAEIQDRLIKMANKLATVRDLKLNNRMQKAKDQYNNIFDDANEVIELIFKFLK